MFSSAVNLQEQDCTVLGVCGDGDVANFISNAQKRLVTVHVFS